MWGTQVYTKESMRGGISELTNKNQNQGEGGLSFDYAMAWSSGVYESVALVIPNARRWYDGRLLRYGHRNL